MKKIQIAIDGPASSGKSTVARRVAADLEMTYLDTGAMYRATTLIALELLSSDSKKIIAALQASPIKFDKSHVLIGTRDVSQIIREQAVTAHVSEISAIPEIREFLVSEQQRIAAECSIIMDGRDIGTVVLPDADLKIFLIADVAERARRRHLENLERGIPSDLIALQAEIEARDAYDSNRKISPLKAASDALIFDTTGKTIAEVVAFIEDKAQAILR